MSDLTLGLAEAKPGPAGFSGPDPLADANARCRWGASTLDYALYHDTEWGWPADDDTRLFEKLCLEGFQAGLSWITILRKRERYREVFADFDPAPGDGQEKPELVPNATDGDPATAWTTEGYGTAGLGGIKPGVGLRATLASPAIVTGVRISSETPGGTVQLLGAAPDVISTRPILGQGVLPDGTGVIALATPTLIGEIVIWMTALPSSGTGDRPFRASIGEVAVLGVAKT